MKSWWVELFEDRERGTCIALLRIGCGLAVLLYVLDPLAAGVLDALFLDTSEGGMTAVGPGPWRFRLLGGVNASSLDVVVVVIVAGSVATIVGFGGRLTPFVLLQAFAALNGVNAELDDADTRALLNVLWLLVLSRSTATLSLDCFLRTGRVTSRDTIPAWPRYLVVAQLVLIYFTSSLQKVSSHWSASGDYSCVYYVLIGPTARWHLDWVASIYPLTQIMTAVVWYLEALTPLLVLAWWYRRTAERGGRLRAWINRVDARRVFAGIAIPLHLGFAVFIGIVHFQVVMLAMLVCLFDPSDLERVGRWITRRGNRHTGEVKTDRVVGKGTGRVAALVLLHVVAISLSSVPTVAPGTTRADLDIPEVHQEFERLMTDLRSVGYQVSIDELKDGTWSVIDRYVRIRSAVLLPFQPYYLLAGTEQGWRMYPGPIVESTSPVVELRRENQWRTVYRAKDPSHRWLAGGIEHEYVNYVFLKIAVLGDDEGLLRYAEWLAHEVSVGDADALRLRLWQVPSPTPEQSAAVGHQAGRLTKTIEVAVRGRDD